MMKRGVFILKYWFDISETIPKGLGFSAFGPEHLAWLVICAVFIAGACRTYRQAGNEKRAFLRRSLAAAIVGNELFKTVMLLIGGNWSPAYLPLHLCSVNILLIAVHAVKPCKLLDNFLYAICIPGAAAALLFPSWTKLPIMNFMYLHSFTVHILLMAYPIMLLSGGDIRPDPKYIPKCVALLGTLALVALVCNVHFGTNFMFLMSAGKGNPLYWFQKHCGSHLVGFLVLIPLVLGAMYLPFLLRRHGKHAVTTLV